ncbi:MAG: MFS transporter [Chloroflexi bacterium]|nr:MFS transporter [Chloroflexota bacterium]
MLLSQRRHQIAATVWCAWFVNLIDRNKTSVLLPLIAASLAMDNATTGWVMFAFFIGFAGAQPFAGFVTDRLGPRKTVTISVAAFSIFTWTMALVGDANELFIRNLLFGIGIGFETTPVYRLIATWFPSHQRGRASAVVFTGIAAGSILTPLIVVPIAQILGSWRWSFIAVSFLGIPMLWMVHRLVADRPELDKRVSRAELEFIFGAEELAKKKGHGLDPSRARSEAELAPGERMVPLRTIFLNRSILLGFGGAFIVQGASVGIQTWLPIYGVQQLKLPLLAAGGIASAAWAGALVGYLLSGWISDVLFRGLRTPLWVMGAFLAAAANFTLPMLQEGMPILAVYAVFALVAVLAVIANNNSTLGAAYISELLTPGAVGRGTSVIVMAAQLGSAVAQPVIAALIVTTQQGAQFAAVFQFMGAALFVAALLYLFMVEPKVKRSYLMYLLSGREEGKWSPQLRLS